MDTVPPPEVRTTAYAVSCFPADDRNGYHFTLKVEYRGRGLWGVFDGPYCLGTDGDFDYEPSPSSRDDEWLSTHRFDLDTALALAKEHAPLMEVNGHTVADVLARRNTKA